jgi:large subunit ribosomal protein L35
MPKMKSVSGAKKRFRFTKKGKVKFRRGYRSHILTHETTKVKRHRRRCGIMSKEDTARVVKQLPYGS